MSVKNPQYTTWAVSENRRKLKIRAIEYKGGACSKCGYAKCPAALQFHHLTPSEKDFQISGHARKWSTIVEELDKTILLCSNCHFELHHAESEIRRKQQEVDVRAIVPVRVPAPCGTSSKYTMGCRCRACTDAHCLRIRKYRATLVKI